MPLHRILFTAALALHCIAATAQAHDGHEGHAPAAPAQQAQAQELTDGVVTRWDARTGKLTLRHGEIRNLSMPPMTMVFTLKHAPQAVALKPGDAVRFHAERANGALVVTHIEAAR